MTTLGNCGKCDRGRPNVGGGGLGEACLGLARPLQALALPFNTSNTEQPDLNNDNAKIPASWLQSSQSEQLRGL